MDEVIKANNLKFHFGYQTYYMDSNDYNTPLKPYFDVNLDWGLAPGLQKTMHITIQDNKFTDNNNIMGADTENEYEFYSIKSIRDDYSLEDDTHQLINIIIQLDNGKINIERSTYTILDVVADVGGYMELVRFLFYYFVSTFSTRKFLSFIYKRMYFTNKTTAIKNRCKKVSHLSDSSSKLSERVEYANADISISSINLLFSIDIRKKLKQYILSISRPKVSA